MRVLELSNKEDKDGRRRVKVILHEIYKDKSQHNKNGITWLEQYCKNNLDSVKGISITCEFINDERTEILGHGETGIEDGVPILENATMIGVLERGYIDDIAVDGETKRALIGEGYIDAMRYKNFVDILEEKLHANETIFGSVEIIGLKENGNRIKYLNGYQEIGRIPTEYRYSGFAILGVMPSDETARLIEINKRKENDTMDDFRKLFEEIKALQDEKEKLENELKEVQEKADALDKELKETKLQELLDKLDESLKRFTDEQKEPVKTEIEEFKKDPVNAEVSLDDIIEKILAEIGKKVFELKEKEMKAEQNSYYKNDILGEVFEINETSSIF